MKRVIVALIVLAGCGGDRSGGGLGEEEFIAVVVELRRAMQEAGVDTAAFEARRDEILEEHGVTTADLRAFVESPERDLHELAEVWDSVGARLTTEEEVR